MNTRMLLAALAAGVVGFLLGWVIFGMLLTGFYETNMVHYDGLMKPMDEMNMPLMFLSNLCVGLVLAYCCHRMGANNLVGGAMAAAIIGFLFYLSVDLGFLSMMNMFANNSAVVVDVLANTVWATCMGATAGAVLGMGGKKG